MPSPSTRNLIRLCTRIAPKTQTGARSLTTSARIMNTIRAAMPKEAHPFERFPTTVKSAKADWGRMGRRAADSGLFFVPFMGFVLGWPLLGKIVLDGRM